MGILRGRPAFYLDDRTVDRGIQCTYVSGVLAIHVLDSHRYLAVLRVLQVLPWPERIVWMEGAVDLLAITPGCELGSRKRPGYQCQKRL